MPKKKILIADDSQQIRKSLREILEINQYDVIGEAGNGLEAIDMYKSLSPEPDIVLLDIIMPQLGGIETLRILKSVNSDIRVVMVSALDSLDRVQECMKAGAKHYILKPFDENKVVEIIRKVLG
ncbi:MAG: response regulator [Candidatus Mariimomonas ferrooxydans]